MTILVRRTHQIQNSFLFEHVNLREQVKLLLIQMVPQLTFLLSKEIKRTMTGENHKNLNNKNYLISTSKKVGYQHIINSL